MILIKNKIAFSKMETAGLLLAQIFDDMRDVIHAGMTTLELDAWIERQIVLNGLRSEMKGYGGYKHVSCISINDEVVHGVPTQTRVIASKDFIKVDVCVSWNGYCADMARPFFIDGGTEQAQALAQVAQRALDKGIEQAIPGNRLGDISAAIQQEIEKAGFGVVRDFAGHGIGKSMHEDPELLNYGKAGSGPLLTEGMAFAIEPMITAGGYDVFVTSDKWTVKTKDKSLAAHVEDTVFITAQGPRVITRIHDGEGIERGL